MKKIKTKITNVYNRYLSLISKKTLSFFNRLKFSKDIKIKFEFENKPSMIYASKDKLAQVFINLIDNSFSYSPRNSEILIHQKNLNKNGIIIISTINRNLLSKLFAISIAENILKWIPKGTHDYNKLITPEELEKVLIKEDFSILDFSGLVFNPLAREWRLSKEIKLVNYFCTARLN